MIRWESMLKHVFEGPRFSDGALDVEAMPELAAYRTLVIKLAEVQWRRAHPERQRLPKNFADRFQMRCVGIEKGSAEVDLVRSRHADDAQLQLQPSSDEFDEAAVIVEETVRAASEGRQLPTAFPKSLLPYFRSWGRTLREGESFQLKSPRGELRARYTAGTRVHLLELVESAWEDSAEATGHVLATNVRQGRFELYPDPTSSYGIDVPLSPEHERVVLEALAEYSEARVRVVGRAAYSADRRIVRFVYVASVQIEEEMDIDNSALWVRISAISGSVPEDAWARVPSDASQRIDECPG